MTLHIARTSLDWRTWQLVELQLPSKELARVLGGTHDGRCQTNRYCTRFFLKYPRCIQGFEQQETITKQVTCFSGSSFAGCIQSRRSTGSCKICYGRHLLESTSSALAVVSLLER